MRNEKGQFISLYENREFTKVCTSCGQELLFVKFAQSSSTKDGLQYRCKSCDNERRKRYFQDNKETQTPKNRWRLILKKYGITQQEWESLFESQGSGCAICSSDSPGKSVEWQTDHNHSSGGVRGILCLPCNIIIGYVEKGWNVLVPAIEEYLKLHS